MNILSKAKNLAAGTICFNIGGFKINLAPLNIMNSNIETPGIGGFLGNPSSLIQTVTQGARGVFCIGTVLTSPSMALNVIRMALEYIEALGISLINDIYKTCLARVNNILAEVYGITLGYFKTIKSIISMVQNVGGLIKDISNFRWERGDSALNELFDRKNCDYMVANLMRCMIAKMLQPYLDKFKNKAIQSINDVASDISGTIQDKTSSLNAMSSYLNQQAKFVDKYTTQVRELL